MLNKKYVHKKFIKGLKMQQDNNFNKFLENLLIYVGNL